MCFMLLFYPDSRLSMACCCCCSSVLVVIALIALYKFLDYLLRSLRLPAFNSRYVLVTGCDTGFGNLAAKRLDGLGCNVFAGCLTEAGEDELRKSCSSRLKTVSLNVADHGSVVKAFEKVKAALPEGRGECRSRL